MFLGDDGVAELTEGNRNVVLDDPSRLAGRSSDRRGDLLLQSLHIAPESSLELRRSHW
jgi:hypothetical protein